MAKTILQKGEVKLTFREYDAVNKYSEVFTYYGFNATFNCILLKTKSNNPLLKLEPDLKYYKGNDVYAIQSINKRIECYYVDKAKEIINRANMDKIKIKFGYVISKIIASIAKKENNTIPSCIIESSIKPLIESKMNEWEAIKRFQLEQLPF